MNKANFCLMLILLLSFAVLNAGTMTVSEFELEVWRLSNIERERYSLPSLAYDNGLAELARLHSRNMLSYGFFAHKDHNGDEVAQRRSKYYPNLLIVSIGENLGKFKNSAKIFHPQDLVNGWMQSPRHRENLLNPNYTHLGIGLVFKGETLYATQVFSTPIAKLLSQLPKKINAKKTYRLSFEYLSKQEATKLCATLIYPDKNLSYKVSEDKEMVGAQPIPIRWKSSTSFEVDIPFLAGKGNYQLCFGFGGGYYPEGLILKAK
ncbi:MAG: CAP domain-containing protein [Candidatus Cloacimonetes bacterium]|nr:CAP domain-containing protein [Candidatus Cloacimonadota bacterium]MDD3282807.1 CAP domain-containing protein [Candidatus Cloacimonadota bacterium]